MSARKCAFCGTDPAAGFASVWVDGRTFPYCHPDEGPSCYEQHGMDAVIDRYWPLFSRPGEDAAEQLSVLRGRIAEALRLHPKYYGTSLGRIGEPWRPTDNMTGREKLWCGNCVEPWPCPTAIALGVQS